MWVSPNAKPTGTATDVTAARHKLQSDAGLEQAAPVHHPLTRECRTHRVLLADLAMILCQVLFFINHCRRLLDASCALPEGSAHGAAGAIGHGHRLLASGSLNAYPCAASTAARIGFLAVRADSTFLASFKLPLGELWVPLVTTAILAQLLTLLLIPPRSYMSYGRRCCMVLVGLLPKAVSLMTFLAFPAERPSSYFDTYLPIEGATTIWQQAIYNYPFWPGLAVLAAHCALSTAICVTVPPRLHAAGAPLLFNSPWVLSHTYCCAVLAACVSIQQHPSSVRRLGAALCRANAAVAGVLAAATGLCRRQRATGYAQLHPAAAAAAPVSNVLLEGQSSGTPEELQLKVVVRRLLAGATSASGHSTCSSSFTASSASDGSSLVASEPGSTDGSGSHVTAADVAQAVCKAAKDGPVGLQKARRHLLLQQQQLSQQQQRLDYRAAGPARAAEGRVEAFVVGMQAVASSKLHVPRSLPSESAIPATAAAVPIVQHVQYTSAPSRPTAGALPPSGALPPAGAFSLKQPTGLSKWTIVEDQEFQPPVAAMGVGVSLDALGQVVARSRRFRRYQSRAPPQRVHMKIPWAEPEQLPGNFLERLNMALSEGLDCMAVGVSVRAGCIELVFDLVPQAAFDSASDYQVRQGRRPRGQQQHAAGTGVRGSDAVTGRALGRVQQHLLPWLPEQQRALGHLELLGQVLPGHAGAVADVSGADATVDESLDLEGALEEAVLGGLLKDAEPASWIEALHLQPPPGAEVLTQACGRVWISRWDHTLRQWVPERAGGIRPSQLPRITQLRPPCVMMRRTSADPTATQTGEARLWQGDAWAHVGSGERPRSLGGAGAVVVRVTVSNADGVTPPSFSARCRGRYLPVVARRLRAVTSESGAAEGEPVTAGCGPRRAAAASPDEFGNLTTFELELPAGLPRNGLVVIECKVGKLLSNWRPLIITDDVRMAEDLASLFSPQAAADFGAPASAPAAAAAGDSSSGGLPFVLLQSPATDPAVGEQDATSWDELLTDLGLWLDYIEVRGLTMAAERSHRSSMSNVAPDSGAGKGSAVSTSGELRAALTAAVVTDWTGGPGKVAANGDHSGAWRRGEDTCLGRGLSAEADAAIAAGSASRQSGSLDLGPGLAALYGTEPYRNHMAGISVSLLEFAVDRGWCHTAGVLVSQLKVAGIAWPEVLRRCSDGLTLLHRAVRSAQSEMVELVVRLGEQNGTPFEWQAVSLGGAGQQDVGNADADATACGVTPLHLAASLPDGGRLAERILSEYQAACELWASAVDLYGMRPVDCARASGHLHLTPRTWNGGARTAAGVAAPAAPAGASVAPQATVAPRVAPVPPPSEQKAPPGKAVASSPLAAGHNEPSSTAATSTTVSSNAAGNVGDEADSAPSSAGSPRRGSSRSASSASSSAAPGAVTSMVAATVTTATAALREAAWVMAAPFVGDRRAEAAYVEAVGADTVLWSCGYHVYELCVILAVAGRMVKELRAHDMGGMIVFCGSHLAAAVLLCANYCAWLRLRELMCAAVTITRTLAKLLPVLGLLPYPHSATNYLSGGMDVVLEGLVPAYFERMRTPFAFGLRAVEGLATGLLYRNQRVQLRLAPPGVSAMAYALAWTLGCATVTAVLDALSRRRFSATTGGGRGVRGALRGRSRGVAGCGGSARGVVAQGGASAECAGRRLEGEWMLKEKDS